MPLPADRHRGGFPALETGIHLLSHSLGPVPRAARAGPTSISGNARCAKTSGRRTGGACRARSAIWSRVSWAGDRGHSRRTAGL